MPREKGYLQSREPGRFQVEETILQLLPETGCRPILDGEAGPLGDAVILAAVEPLELIAEVERVRAAVPALAEIVKAQAEGFAHGKQPFKVGCAKSEQA